MQIFVFSSFLQRMKSVVYISIFLLLHAHIIRGPNQSKCRTEYIYISIYMHLLLYYYYKLLEFECRCRFYQKTHKNNKPLLSSSSSYTYLPGTPSHTSYNSVSPPPTENKNIFFGSVYDDDIASVFVVGVVVFDATKCHV